MFHETAERASFSTLAPLETLQKKLNNQTIPRHWQQHPPGKPAHAEEVVCD
jgi:hypothetical protein